MSNILQQFLVFLFIAGPTPIRQQIEWLVGPNFALSCVDPLKNSAPTKPIEIWNQISSQPSGPNKNNRYKIRRVLEGMALKEPEFGNTNKNITIPHTHLASGATLTPQLLPKMDKNRDAKPFPSLAGMKAAPFWGGVYEVETHIFCCVKWTCSLSKSVKCPMSH